MMSAMDPITKGMVVAGAFAGAIFLAALAAIIGGCLAGIFEVWRVRRCMRKEIERHIAAMNTCAPEGGRKHRPF